MKPISKIKDEARRHEQREEWEQAAGLYLEALRSGDEGEGEVELPLYNRVGDLHVRMGRPDAAVQYYEQAADRYAEAGLYNNAIALCNKALRYQPDRLELLRKLGQFSASQGFIVEARRHFLDYAERQFAAGAVDAALEALEDFADVAEGGEVRELLGRRLQAHGRSEDAVDALGRAFILYTQEGEHDRADTVLTAIREIEPSAADALDPTSLPDGDAGASLWDEPEETEESRDDAGLELEPAGDFDAAPAPAPAPAPASTSAEPDPPEGFGGSFLSPDDVDDRPPEGFEAFDPGLELDDRAAEPVETVGLDGFSPTGELPDEAGSIDVQPLDGFEAGSLDFAAAAAELGSVESDLELERDDTSFDEGLFDDVPPTDDEFLIPTTDAEAEDEVTGPADDDEAFALPALEDYDVAAEGSPDDGSLDETGAGFMLPGLEYDDEPAAGDSEPDDFALPPLDGEEAVTEQPEASQLPLLDDDDGAGEATLPLLGPPDDEPGAGLPLLDDDEAASLSVGALDGDQPLEVAEPPAAAGSPRPDPPREAEPVLSAEEEFIDLGQLLAEERSESTRFQVQETAPTGDEDRDFAELLSQFKTKLSEHLPPEDAAAHYDLGLAFKEMGLIDEAISEFQVSLRAGQTRLKVFEELGDCFLQKAQFNIAEKVLRRGLEMDYDDELELLGVYYHLGRAYEGMGRSEDARDAYERVLGLDINFRDVSNRLARL